MTGTDHVLPPSVDFDSISIAVVPPQSPVGPVAEQRIHVTYTVPSEAIPRSLNWSIVGNATASTMTSVNDPPLFVEFETTIAVFEFGSNSVVETYISSRHGLFGPWSICSHG